MQSPTDCTTGWHLRDALERDIFARQTVLYLGALNRRIAGLAERATSAELPPHALIATYEEVHLSFRMRFWAVESAAALVRRGAIALPDGLAQVRAALKVALALFAKRSEGAFHRLHEARRELAALTPGRDHQIIVAHDVEPPDLSVDDDYSWVRRCYDAARGPLLGVRWEMVEPITAPVAPVSAGSTVESHSTPTIRLTRSQSNCAESLRTYWLAQREGTTAGGYSLRPPLLAAASGSGKTRVVRWFAESMRMPLLILDTGSWLISGSRADKTTLQILQEWHQQNDRGVLLLDELDKATATDGGWWQAVNLEVMAYIDGRLNWPTDLAKKVRSSFMIVGAGAWQGLFRANRRGLGFAVQNTNEDMASKIEADFGAHSRAIPQELGFRFDPPLLLGPPERDEFAERIQAIRRETGFSAANPPAPAALVEDAVVSQRGQRWLEGYAGRMMRERCLAVEKYDALHF